MKSCISFEFQLDRWSKWTRFESQPHSSLTWRSSVISSLSS